MVDTSNIWLKTSYFLLSNKDYFKKWWAITLIALDVFVIIFTFTNLIVYLVSIPRESKLMVAMAQNQVEYSAIRLKNIPINLEIVEAKALPGSNNKLNLIALVQNNNGLWMAEKVQYKYTISGQETDSYSTFILPNEGKYLTAFNVGLGEYSSSLDMSMVIEDVDWKRIDDPSRLEAIDFLIENPRYTTTTATGAEVFHQVTASITNDSYLGFWETEFAVILYDAAENIVGIEYTHFNPFKRNTTESLLVQWERVGGYVSKAEIKPYVNVFDSDNIM
ncbi:hypothetical protein KKF61_00945 [Patescibacteria group bacterium]|nr:hypothetical protein [Patescibacteria group bacterium]MBU0963748.1 hypothetical protein [Patescibacteria group bacterium]